MEDTPVPIWKRLLPFALLLAALALFFALGLHRYVSVEALRENRAILLAWTDANPLLAGLACVAFSAALMAMGFPSIGVVMVAAGLVLGLWQGFLLSLLGATAGGTVLFLAARNARETLLATRMGALLKRLQRGAAKNAFLYLLSLRLMPIFPTGPVTLAAAAAHLRLRDFFWATLLGSAPASFVFTSIGSGAGAVLDNGGDVDLLRALLRPDILLPLLALAALALATAWFKSRMAKGEPA